MAHVNIAQTPERDAFYEKISKGNLAPLWSVLNNLVPDEPTSPCVPYLWRFNDVRTAMEEASGLITAKEATRRVLVLENPGLRGQTRVTTSLFAGIQCIMPGETAPAHRHSQSALRLILEGTNSFTSVDGERAWMHYGDFVVTPGMTWHDHANHSDKPMYWLDGLDIPIVTLLNASFFERYPGPGDINPITKTDGDSLMRFGVNMLPDGYKDGGHVSPIFSYPYDRSREALFKLSKQGEFDPYHGIKLRYINPVTGTSAMPTIGTALQLLPKGFKTMPYQSTDATVFVCLEGKGKTRVRDQVIEWGPKDIFVVPSWFETVHEPEEESVLFSYSDRPVHEKLGLWRERRGNS